MEIIRVYLKSKSIHLLYAIFAALGLVPLVISRIVSTSTQDDYEYKLSLVYDSGMPVLLWLIIAALCFVLLNAVTNFQFEQFSSKERKLRIDAEQNSLDSLIALSIAQDNETGSRNLRKRKYVQALVDNLKSKGWFTMPDPDAHIDQLFSDSLHTYRNRCNSNGGSNVSEGLGEEGSPLGDSSPQTARVMAVADVYDVLTSKRSWKRSWTHKQAIAEISEMAGSRLDPAVVQAFLEEEPTFSAIAHAWRDD